MKETLGRLIKVNINSIWKTEYGDFTPWLANEENIKLLSDELNLDLEVVQTEKPVGPFRADILCKDTTTGNYVIIENQYGKTDHTHLGQIMTYASGLKAFTVVWIAESFTEEHRAALDWINSITEENVEFFGIEIELYRIGESPAAPMFNIVSKPNSWSKSVKRGSQNSQVTPTMQLYQEFWQSLKDYVEPQNLPFRLIKAQPQNWTNIAIGRSGYKLCAVANQRENWIGVQLVVFTENSLEDFNRLKSKYEIDSKEKVSPSVEWVGKEGTKEQKVNLIFEGNVLDDMDGRDKQLEILTDGIIKFYNYFKEKVKNN